MNGIIAQIENAVGKIETDLITIRRHLHQYPETGRKEHNTTKYIFNSLTNRGIHCKKSSAGVGIVAEIPGKNADITFALRGDIDALPIADAKNVPYRSKNEGVAHACGHDFHTTVVLGTALVLKSLSHELPANVRFIFQHCEEAMPSGAQDFIDDGVLENVKGILGFHAEPTIETGKVALREGQITAGIDSFKIRIEGKSGHSARPHLAIDPVAGGAMIVNDLYRLFPRKTNPFNPFSVSICSFHGGHGRNTIPGEAVLEGTMRMLDYSQQEEYRNIFQTVIESTAKQTGSVCTLDFEESNPPVINNKKLTERVRNTCRLIYGEKNIVEANLSLGAEDFSLYSSAVPGCYIRIGTGGKEQFRHPLHSNLFNIDEEAIAPTVKLFSYIFLMSVDCN